MKPTICRIVLYKNTDGEKHFQNEAEHVPAIITRVFSDECVNLTIFVDGATMLERKTSVMLGTGPGQWSWPERGASA